MYNKNPLHIAGAQSRGNNKPNRRRNAIGVEFNRSAYCAANGQYYDPLRESCPPAGASGGGGGGFAPFGKPGGYNWGPYTPYSPSNPPVISTVPYNPPVTTVPTIPTTTPIVPGNPACCPPLAICPENMKRFTMPFTPGTGSAALVTAGATAVFIGSPQALFRPDRLIIPSTIGPYFDVLSFSIANQPQTMGAGAVPADIYSEVSTYTEMSFDQAYPGVQITLTVQNKSSVSQTFQAALIGWSVG